MAAVSITAANVLPSAQAQIVNKTAGAAITAGQPVYLDTSGNANPATCNGSTPTFKVYGIAVDSAPAAGQPVEICIQDPLFTPGFTTAKGTIYIAGTTAGSINPAADATTGWNVSALMVGISTTQANLFPCSQCRADVAI